MFLQWCHWVLFSKLAGFPVDPMITLCARQLSLIDAGVNFFFDNMNSLDQLFCSAMEAATSLNATDRLVVIKKEDFAQNPVEYMKLFASGKLSIPNIPTRTLSWIRYKVKREKHNYDEKSPEKLRYMLFSSADTAAKEAESCQTLARTMEYDFQALRS